METFRSINPKRLILSIVILLAISAALLLFARDLIREVFVIPISYLIWIIGIFARTTPQIFFWIGLLVISALIAYRSLWGRRRIEAPPSIDMLDLLTLNAPSQGRVSFWRIKTALLRNSGTYYQVGFHNTLGRLLLDLLAYRYRLTPSQVEDRLEEGTLDVPDDIRQYVVESQSRYMGQDGEYFKELWQAFVNWLRGLIARQSRNDQPGPLFSGRRGLNDPRISRILDYMKEELEVSHDDSGY